MPTCV
jgi:hypothetical protein